MSQNKPVAIDISKVKAVLLPQGGINGWHKIDDGSFKIGEIQFTGRGQGNDFRVKEPMAYWTAEKTKEWYGCPFNEILAFRYEEE